jgi:NCS1 family nucleobase:cation symporter-1
MALVPALGAVAAFAWPVGLVTAGLSYFFAMGGQKKLPTVATEAEAVLEAAE